MHIPRISRDSLVCDIYDFNHQMSLLKMWINEKLCPELLNFQHDIVQCVLEQMKQMEKNLQKTTQNDFRAVTHKMELDRIRFVLASYLRHRINKIEKFTASILKEVVNKEDPEDMLLSPEEYKFAKEHLNSLETHFNTVVVQQMPQNLQNLNLEKHMPKPEMDSYVFLKLKEDIMGVLVDNDTDENREEDTVDLEKGAQHIMRYRPIATYVLLTEEIQCSANEVMEITGKYVLDGGALLHRVHWVKGMKFNEVAKAYVNYIRRNYGSAFIVFDGYDSPESIKSNEHLRRAGSKGSTPNIIITEDNEVPYTKERFL
ncbi:DNA replication complex GINS protein SLD5 [Nymphon striatum]|nr:DNA replication complex GINS protein SLD5 [Nymphon striatum]